MKTRGFELKRKVKKLTVTTLCTVCLMLPLSQLMTAVGIKESIVMASTENAKIKELSQTIISQGVVRKDYTFTTTRNNKAINTGFHVIEVDLSNQYLTLQALSADNSETVAKRANVRTMATQTGAIAAINGDVFAMVNEGAPLGTHINKNGLQVSPSLLQGMYAFGVTKEKRPIIDSYLFEGTVTASTGASFALAGINKSTYSSDVTGEAYSHVNNLFIYTSAWGGKERPINSATTATEVLVVDGIVMEKPIGVVTSSIPANGYVLRGHGKAAEFLNQLTIGDVVNADYYLISQTTKQKVNPDDFSMMVSGHTLLIDQGQAVDFTRSITGVSGNSYTSRTAVGYSADRKTVYFVTAEKSGANTGVNLKELQALLKRLGVDKAVNLDGGGSTTMVERKLGTHDIVLSHRTQESSLRPVTNAIGVFTHAPAGQLAGIIVEGAELMFVGQTTNFSHLTYDTFYNPLKDVSDIVYTDEKGLGSFAGQSFTASKVGLTTIVAKNGQISGKKALRIIGAKDISGLISQSGTGLLSPGYALDTTLVATLTTGEQYKIDGKYLQWSFIGFDGTFKDGQIVVNSINPSAQYGYAIATYDGFTTMIPFSTAESESTIEDFNSTAYPITSQVIPADQAKGSVSFVGGMNGNPNDKALQLTYDFSQGNSGTQASYAVFNNNGIELAESVKSIRADILGDGGNHWLRAELVDSSGALHYVDFAKKVDWTGWRNVEVAVDIADSKLKLRRIYVIALDATKSDLAKSGSILIDNLKQVAVGSQAVSNGKVIELIIDSSTAAVNGESIKLDVAPRVVKETTFLPFRTVAEQLGAQINYNEKEKSISVFYADKFVKLYINQKEYILNGERKQAAVAPFISQNRTLIPVRLISESIGFTVDYLPEKKQVTIR